jgi:hypothetical protein
MVVSAPGLRQRLIKRACKRGSHIAIVVAKRADVTVELHHFNLRSVVAVRTLPTARSVVNTFSQRHYQRNRVTGFCPNLRRNMVLIPALDDGISKRCELVQYAVGLGVQLRGVNIWGVL